MATIPLLLMTIHTLLPMLQGKVINIVTIDERVNLTCQPNSSIGFTWSITSQSDPYDIFKCGSGVNSGCVRQSKAVLSKSNFTCSWNGNLSVLSFSKPETSVESYRCEQLGNELQNYSVTFINPDEITDPVCEVAASSQDGDLQVTLSCESTISQGEMLGAVFRIEGTGKTNSTKPLFSPNINENLDYETFLNIANASCVLFVSGTVKSLNRSCQYPKAVDIDKTIEGNDLAIRCDVESNSEVTWIVYDSDERKIDIKNTSWTRDGGRSLLIRGVSSNDLESKVVECRTYRDGSKSMIGYTTISTSINENTDDKVRLTPTPDSNNDSFFFVPTMLFLTLWLITTTLFGVWWWRNSMERKPSPSSMPTISDPIGQTLEVNRPSTVGSNTNGEDGAYNDTPLANIETHSHRRAMSYNLNNSAHNPSFAAGNDRDAAQLRNSPHSLESSNLGNESQLYFTLERSSPSPVNSLQRASTPRWEHPDVNPASLDKPQRQSSHSQCYETVGEPNKGATCSYDLGEYAEVGYGKGPPDLGEYAEVDVPFQGKRPPDLSGRPSIRKKPEREKVKEDDISRLYSKVNK